jgi:hypothetical protein
LFVFRSREAHAWTEVLLEGHGWTVLDATPPGALERELAETAEPDAKPPGTEELLAEEESVVFTDAGGLKAPLLLAAAFVLPALVLLVLMSRRVGSVADGMTGERGGGGSLAWEDAVGALDEGFDAEAFEVAAEVAVGVEEVTDDEVEGGEVVGDFLLDGGAGGEERGEVAVTEAAGVVGEAGGEGEVGDAGVTKDFEVAVGDAFFEEADGRQGEDEVTDGAATDD